MHTFILYMFVWIYPWALRTMEEILEIGINIKILTYQKLCIPM